MMLQRFVDYASEQHLFPPRGEVLLAVSGGRDSVALAHLAHSAGIPFAVAHCNFHLRPGECDRDQAFVERLAADLHAECHLASFDTRAFAAAHGMSIEEAARHLRYRWFADLCRRHAYGTLATAHHRDDSIETFFLNLFRGTGIAGLHGIRPVSELRIENEELRIIRPLLCFSRADIDAFVAEHRLAYVEDSTNSELDARRNRLRLRLMPLLRELYPAVDTTMAANIERLHATGLIYQSYIDELRTRLIKPYPSKVPDLPVPILSLSLDELASFHFPLPAFLFELLRPYGFNASTVADILTQGEGRTSSGRLFYSPSYMAELHRGLLLLAPRVAVAPPAMPSVRLWRPGDRFRPKGMHGSRLVSDFLKDLHLSRIEKQYVRVLVDDSGVIRSVVGLRDAEPQ